VEANLKLAQTVLSGQQGPPRDVVLLNGAASLYVAGLVDSIEAGIQRTAQELDSGRVKEKIREIAEVSQRVKTEAPAEIA
jgi:anthranilate phosphoribosyltransferase